MSKEKTMTERITALRPGQSFIVKTLAERNEVYATVKVLEDLKKLQHEIKSTSTGSGFKIYAI